MTKRKRAHISRETELAAALLMLPQAVVDQQYRTDMRMMLRDLIPNSSARECEDVLVKILARAIPHDHAKLMAEPWIISLYHRDHDPFRHEYGGPDEAWNLTWRLGPAHRVKSAAERTDAAKERKVRRAEEKHKALLAYAFRHGTDVVRIGGVDVLVPRVAPDFIPPKRKRKIPSRPFPKRRKK